VLQEFSYIIAPQFHMFSHHCISIINLTFKAICRKQ